jgi:hypothetical protein
MPTKEERNVFSNIVIERAHKRRTDYIDAMVTHCQEIGMDVEDGATLINDVLKARIEEEAEVLRIIPRISRLSV